MKFSKLIFTLIIGFVMACDNKIDGEIEKLNTVLMKGHDEVMPKTMAIADVKKDLMAASEKASEADKATALKLSTDLQKAEDDMYEWMKNFGVAMNDVKDKNEKLKLYTELEVEVKKLTENTGSAISAAKKYTEEHK
jgi:TusA-related sulfurtransferase